MTRLPLSTSHKWIFSSIGNSSFPYYPSLIGSSQPDATWTSSRQIILSQAHVGRDGWMDGWVDGEEVSYLPSQIGHGFGPKLGWAWYENQTYV